MCHHSFINLLALVWKIFEKINIVLLFCSLVYVAKLSRLIKTIFLLAYRLSPCLYYTRVYADTMQQYHTCQQ